MDFVANLAKDVTAANLVRSEPSENPFKFYHYHPTEVGAIIFVLLFLATTLGHCWQLFRYRVWFATPIIIGGIFEMIGYGARYASGKETPDWTLTPYILQAILLLVSPALYAATIYMELGRIVSLVDGEGHALIPRKWTTKIFVVGDILSFFLQGGGGGYQSSGTLEALNTGATIIIIGLFVQLAFFGVFLVVAVTFHVKILRAPTGRSRIGIPWQKHLKLLYATGLLIMVRSIFRAVEYLQGFDGYLLAREAYLYVFDALLMFIVMVLFNLIHPAELFTRQNRIENFAAGIGLQARY
ncbi:RTA1-domain-containing protein [Thozetella sp. PMI_491]|nr:RTA1-domain-containing protein [Thozetella sp. PMI_491]